MEPSRRRWSIALLLLAATALSYMDRLAFPIVFQRMKAAFTLSQEQYGQMMSLFLLAYGVMYAVGGRIMDLLGARLGYAVMIIWWSLATALHGLVGGVVGLAVARVLLGAGEGGGFPGSAKAVAEWFPAKERATAVGLFNVGSAIGMAVAAPLSAVIVLSLGWQWVFYLMGIAGLVWAGVWVAAYRLPQSSGFANASHSNRVEAPMVGWLELSKNRAMRSLLFARFLSEGAWYFLIFWLPKYLSEARGLEIKDVGLYAWVPYAFAGAGSLFGGWFSTMLMRWLSLSAARKVALGMAVSVMPFAALIDQSPLSWAIVFYSLPMLGHQFWSTILQTLPADLFPSSAVGTAAGLLGAVGTLGAAIFSLIAGSMLAWTGGNYGAVFLVAGLIHPLSFLVVLLTVGRIEVQELRARVPPAGDASPAVPQTTIA
ncbi:MAG TPA: MFS transporter [Caulifigura sp.]|jgi:ACS family hexuronate transporter-like MFS transporter|nr:MFS transporter [Caulifigura sp.]